MSGIKKAISRRLRGPAASRLLARLGIDARQYWLLMDLFSALSERHELLNQLGRAETDLKVMSGVFFGMTAVGSLLFLIGQPHLTTWIALCLAFPAAILLSILVSETGNSLVNPEEGLVLAHQPINGATYTAAKLSHLLRIVLYMAGGLNLAPALLGLAVAGAPWYYPIAHMLAAFALGFLLALACCAVFGWLIRIVPPRRLKTAAETAAVAPWFLLFLSSRLQRALAPLHLSRWLPAGAAPRAACAAGLAIAVLIVAVLGLRALSADYLIHVSEMMHGGRRRVKARKTRPGLGAVVARLAGGQPARAGFEYVARMMRRDWHFRRQIVALTPTAVIAAGAVFSAGLRTNPFSHRLTVVHGLPHIIGFALFAACTALPHGSATKGVWVFLSSPGAAFVRFGNGVFALLWFLYIGLPHAVLLPFLAWYWGTPDALLFLAYSVAAASAYLSLELRLIDGVPFTQPPDPSQGLRYMLLTILGMFVVAVAVAIQYFLIFRSRAIAAASTVAIAAVASVVTRNSLRALERQMRYSLGLLRDESGRFYKEVA
jgi:hypothetical protein